MVGTTLFPVATVCVQQYVLAFFQSFRVLQVKMVTADDDSTTDIVVEGDQEEVTRMSKELQFVEKGKVYVKGLLE